MYQSFQSFRKKTAILTCLLLALGTVAFAQVKYSFKENASLVVSGTSTLHDWTMKSGSTAGDVTVVFDASGKITDIQNVQFTTVVDALKSGKGGMDKNAYNALLKEKNPNITFNSSNVTVTAVGANHYQIKSIGALTIAGTTKDVELLAKATLNADKTIVIEGSKKINMKDFGVKPPSFMMGTIKTGENITLQFTVPLGK
ncbi:MAG: YceI family protein [Chitinophagaceae bacterium]